MRRVALLFAGLILIMQALPAQAAPPWPGTFERYRYTNANGARDYMVYVPSSLLASEEDPGLPDPEPNPAPVPVVVYLHGCTQVAPDAALGTRFNDVAEQQGFIVVYPEQDPAANGSRCWNWFLPEHQVRGSGEASIIAGITETVVGQRYGSRGRYTGDPKRTYVLGASAGGVMSGNMGVAYPDLYAAIGVLAGCAYLTCADTTGQIAYENMGEHARVVPTIVFQGTADALVNYPLGRTVLYQWLGTNDLADDGELNRSIALQPEIEHRAFDQQPQPTSGDLCIAPPASFPCAGGALGIQGQYPHTIERYRGIDGTVVIEFWTIHGLGHAYPSGNPDGSFVDPLGPDVTAGALDFFFAHPMP